VRHHTTMGDMTINLSRYSRRYIPGETVAGEVAFDCKGTMSHNGVTLVMEGTVLMEVTTGIKKAFTFPKPFLLTTYTEELAKAGNLPNGKSALPFKFQLEPLVGQNIYETFHGNNINVRYIIRCTCVRGFARKNLEADMEFLVEVKSTEEHPKPRECPFTITDTAAKSEKGDDEAKVKIGGKLTATTCQITQPVIGELVIEESAFPIASIHLQLMRVETCGHLKGFLKEATEIERIEIADGDIPPKLPLMLFMILPRQYTCPTVHSPNFKIEFELNILVQLQNDAKSVLTRTFPLLLVRS